MVDLLPPEYREEKTINMDKVLIAILILSLVMVPVSYCFKLILETKKVEQKYNIAQAKLKQVNKQTEELNKLEKKYQGIKDDLHKQKEVVGGKIYLSAILKELKAVIPDQSWVKDLNIRNRNNFKIDGYTLNRQELGEIITKLKRSPYFSSISIDATNKKELDVSGYKKEVVTYYQISGIIGENEGDSNGLE